MADRLTQLQDTVNMQAENFCNSIGILQQCSSSSNPQNPSEDYAQLFSQLISRTAKDIEILIESLPNEESSTELQLQSLKVLETENQEAAEHLEEVVRKGEQLLQKIQSCLADISKTQLEMSAASTKKTAES